MKKETLKISSCDGAHQLAGVVYIPEGEPKAYLQLVHGMAEHMGRYESFMETMAEMGYICFGYDHLGHGATADSSELGFIARKNGFRILCRDVERFASAVREKWGELPYYLMGHSMGSFMVRISAATVCCPDKLIVLGTAAANPLGGVGIAICRLLSCLHGERYVSRFVKKNAFGSYNKHFGGEGENAWLTKCKSVVAEYEKDPLCGFDFTVSAMEHLMRLNGECNKPYVYRQMSKDVPVLLMSGSDDPVGSYGRGVEAVCKAYAKAGCSVQMKLYEGCRHEILNETCREIAVRDINEFLSNGK